MGTADEIGKLHALVKDGALTQAEFETAKAELFRRQSAGSAGDPLKAAAEGANRLRLSDSDKWIAGVCGGLGKTTGVDSWIWRLLFALGLFLGGVTLVLYVLLWVFVPREY
jgi:phage shock protein PspC (stress-responsive transcriptional regulator)